MAKVEIYTTALCPFCYRAKRLLQKKGVAFEEYDVTSDPGGRAAMRQRADDRSTVPQIFIDGTGIGGCEELHALETDGRLDPMLAA